MEATTHRWPAGPAIATSLAGLDFHALLSIAVSASVHSEKRRAFAKSTFPSAS
jgi:hypothetical protein